MKHAPHSTPPSEPALRLPARCAALAAALACLALAALFAIREQSAADQAEEVAPKGSSPPVPAVESLAPAPKSAREAVDEAQRRLGVEGAQNNEPLKPVGIHFEAFPTAPERKIVDDPTLGRIIEIRYPNGAVLYTFNDERFDMATQKMIGREFEE